MRFAEIVVIDDLAREAVEIVGLVRKGVRDFVAERAVVVVEPEPRGGEGDFGTELGGDREIVPTKAELTQQAGERAGLRAFGRELVTAWRPTS